MEYEIIHDGWDSGKRKIWAWKNISKHLYETLELCIDSFAIEDRNLDFVVHDLEVWEEVELDTHTVDERVVANNGKFEITIGEKKYLFDAKEVKGYVLFHIPKGTKHSLKTLEKTKYYVFKGK